MRHPVPKSFGATAFLLPTLAFAHAGHSDSGLLAGLMHSFTGLDHLLAIVGVGLWGASRGASLGQALRLPLLFIAMMLLGALSARAGLQLLALGPLLAVSLLGIGLALLLRRRGPALLAGGLCASAGFLHGAAHGQELQGTGALVGMLVATAVGHGLGLWLGRHLVSSLVGRDAMVWRLLGLALAGAGTGLLLT